MPCSPSVATLVKAHAWSGRSANAAGVDVGSSAQRVCPTVLSGSVAAIVTATGLTYQPFDPLADGGSRVIVVVGGVLETSYAPMSGAAPCGRRMPRWSSAGLVPTAASIAGLPAPSFIVGVRPGGFI